MIANMGTIASFEGVEMVELRNVRKAPHFDFWFRGREFLYWAVAAIALSRRGAPSTAPPGRRVAMADHLGECRSSSLKGTELLAFVRYSVILIRITVAPSVDAIAIAALLSKTLRLF
jgi:hypothetical protein